MHFDTVQFWNQCVFINFGERREEGADYPGQQDEKGATLNLE